MPEITSNSQCPVCGQSHRPVALRRGERALCVRCGELLARRSWLGERTSLAFTLAAAALAVPAATMPLVTLSRFGNQRVSFLISSVRGLWRHDLPLLATWVLFCGLIAPFILLGLVLWAMIETEQGAPHPRISRLAHRVQQWAMPEVYVLAILVAFLKLGDLVHIAPGPGLWCYGLMAVCTLVAWRDFSLGSSHAARSGKKAEEDSV
jgi:paraquat-inducible protein A